ncbi:MAG: hypothetical protein HY881_01535 [Deltaproteobacteria bacterium]|nr:hypothetical protein [Deltaproteobacteria bacterium]
MRRTSEFAIDAEIAWQEVLKPRLLDFVAYPMLRFEYLDPATRPAIWNPGNYLVDMRVLGLIPFGTQVIGIEIPDDTGAVRQLRDNGHSRLIRTWDHRVMVEPLGYGRCRYTDEIHVQAGLLTPFIWMFAWIFYRHRQRRWKKLIAAGFDYSADGV